MSTYPLEHLSFESELTFEEHGLKFRVLKEPVMIGIKSLEQLVQWLHGLCNAITHSLNKEGIEGSENFFGELGNANVDTEGTLDLCHRLEKDLNFFVAHLEVLIPDLLNAFLELSQTHHLKVCGVYQSLKLLLIQISGLDHALCDSDYFIGDKVKLWDTLDFSEEGPVSEESDVSGVKHITQEPLLLCSQLDADLVQGNFKLALLKLPEVLKVHLLEYRAHSQALILWSVQPAFQAYQKFFNVSDFSGLLSLLIYQRDGLANVLESTGLAIVDYDRFHLALHYDVVIL